MKQICSQKSYKGVSLDMAAMRTKLSRVTFVAGLSLMALCCCMAEASMGAIAVTGVSGSVLALGSLGWTGWIDTDYISEDD